MKAALAIGKRMVGLSLVASLVSPAWAAETREAGTSALQSMLGEQAKAESLAGQFDQSKYIADLDTTLDSSGDFAFDADEGLRWNIQKPVPTQLRITADEIVEEQDGEVVMRMDVDDQPMTRAISEVFFAIFGGNWDKLSERFTIRTLQDGSPWRFELTPKGDMLQSHLSSIELQGEAYLNALILRETNGDQTHIQLHDVKAR